MSLTNKQQAFVREYTRDFNATRAAKAAGYSDKTAYSYGQQLLKNLEIQDAIKAHIAEVSMSEDEVKTRLADIARGDIADLLDINPSSYNLKLMVDGEVNPKTKLIRKIKQKVTTILAKSESAEDREIVETEIELYSAHDALRDIGKMYAMFTDKQEQSGEVSLKIVYTNPPTVDQNDIQDA